MSSNGKTVFCLGCREDVSVKKSVLDLHIKSKKHVNGKERLLRKERREADIVVALKSMIQRYILQVKPCLMLRVYRLKVVAFLQAGVPLSKTDAFRELLE